MLPLNAGSVQGNVHQVNERQVYTGKPKRPEAETVLIGHQPANHDDLAGC